MDDVRFFNGVTYTDTVFSLDTFRDRYGNRVVDVGYGQLASLLGSAPPKPWRRRTLIGFAVGAVCGAAAALARS